MSATATPQRSLTQRMEALQQANEIRTTRAAWKRDVKAGRADPLVVLAEPPAEFASMKVFDALMALPKVGRVKALTLLRSAQASPSKTLAGLSERQRNELVLLLSCMRYGRR